MKRTGNTVIMQKVIFPVWTNDNQGNIIDIKLIIVHSNSAVNANIVTSATKIIVLHFASANASITFFFAFRGFLLQHCNMLLDMHKTTL